MTADGSENRWDHGKWSRPGVPQKGWYCVEVTDLEEPSFTCEMCESQIVRYVHHMRHPDYPEELGCGCICAGHMEQDYAAARQRERALRNAGRRRLNWVRRTWRQSRRGNPYVNVDGHNVTIFPVRGRDTCPAWGFRVLNRGTQARLMSQQPYATEEEAKLAAFDVMSSMKFQPDVRWAA